MKVFEAFFDDYNVITINLLNADYKDAKEAFKLYDVQNNVYIDTKIVKTTSDKMFTYVTLHFSYALNIGSDYLLFDCYKMSVKVKYRLITQSPKFDKEFANDELLGVNYSEDETIFKLWAPTAKKVILHLEDNYYELTRLDKGIHRLSLKGDHLNKKYTYLVDVNGVINEVVDPYSLLSGNNASYSIITKPQKIEPLHEVVRHDSIYEVSVRDYSKDHSFKSLKERIPYLASLNVSTIQLMPILDFGSVDENNKDLFYNWGYDPRQYFTFTKTYSENPIVDFKDLVNEFHKYGLNVTLDEVFNHVFDVQSFALNKVVPYYYFRFKDLPRLKLTKFSGCQNDFRSEAKMAYKFIKDVLTYLISYFDIDGIRFDLMGLLDLTTVQKLVKDIKEIKPSAIIYGEGWNMNPYLKGATLENAALLSEVSFFNDYYRDNLINLLKGDYTKWYYFTDTMKGNHASDFVSPLQSINYIECHDGYTMFDNMNLSDRKKDAKKLCDLGMAFVSLSQGISFYHQGQEVYHSKKGLPNTYNAGDKINKISEFKDNNMLSKLLEIRKNNQDCFFTSYEDVSKYVKIEVKDNVIYYTSKNLHAILNYSSEEVYIDKINNVLLKTSNDVNCLQAFDFIIYKD